MTGEGATPADEPKIEWLRDTVGMDEHGNVVFKFGDNTYFTATPRRFVDAVQNEPDLKFEIEILERKVNAREPARWVPDAIAELKARAMSVEASRDTKSRLLLLGQVQAYHDAAALIESFVQP